MGSDSCSKWRPRMSPEAFNLPNYIASKPVVEWRHGASSWIPRITKYGHNYTAEGIASAALTGYFSRRSLRGEFSKQRGARKSPSEMEAGWECVCGFQWFVTKYLKRHTRTWHFPIVEIKWSLGALKLRIATSAIMLIWQITSLLTQKLLRDNA